MRIWGEGEALDYQEFPWEHIVVKHWEINISSPFFPSTSCPHGAQVSRD